MKSCMTLTARASLGYQIQAWLSNCCCQFNTKEVSVKDPYKEEGLEVEWVFRTNYT